MVSGHFPTRAFLKYAVYENINSSPVSSGVISTTGDIELYGGFYVSSISKTYYVYVWLDGNMVDNDYLNTSFICGTAYIF